MGIGWFPIFLGLKKRHDLAWAANETMVHIAGERCPLVTAPRVSNLNKVRRAV